MKLAYETCLLDQLTRFGWTVSLVRGVLTVRLSVAAPEGRDAAFVVAGKLLVTTDVRCFSTCVHTRRTREL